MSKTTIALLIVFFIAVGIFFVVMYQKPQKSMAKDAPQPARRTIQTKPTVLSLETDTPAVRPGQIITVAILVHEPVHIENLAQIELGFDPRVLTVEQVLPGTFLTNPTVMLYKVDAKKGRLSYALRCNLPQSALHSSCTNAASKNLATITLRINPFQTKGHATLSLLPKTTIRDAEGKDITHKTRELQLTIDR